MKNKKGFTLVELLAVIVVLGIILLIAVPNISKVIENSKRKAFIVEAQNFADATKKYKATNTDTTNVTYGKLKKENYIESSNDYKGYATIDGNNVSVILCNKEYCVEETDSKSITVKDLVKNKYDIDEITEYELQETIVKNRAIEFMNQSLKYYNDNYQDEGEIGYTNYNTNTICIDYNSLSQTNYITDKQYMGTIFIKEGSVIDGHFYTTSEFISEDNKSDKYISSKEINLKSRSEESAVIDSCKNVSGYTRRVVSKKEVLSKITNIDNYNKDDGNETDCYNYKDEEGINKPGTIYKITGTINNKTKSIRTFVQLDNGFYVVAGNYSDNIVTDIIQDEYLKANVTLNNINLGSIKYYHTGSNNTSVADTFGCLK